jgi:hypothetical protein
MSKYLTHANIHRLLVLVICNMATTVQGFLTVGHVRWQPFVTGTLAAGLSAALGWLIGNLSSEPPASA